MSNRGIVTQDYICALRQSNPIAADHIEHQRDALRESTARHETAERVMRDQAREIIRLNNLIRDLKTRKVA